MYVIETENLVKKFRDFVAVDSLSLTVKKGEVFGFLGANGAGKTTAMRMFCGLLRPSSGIGKVAGFDIYKQTNDIKKNIGYMSQKFSLYNDLSVAENMRLFAGIYGMRYIHISKKIEKICDELQLQHVKHTLVQDLPLGIKQKVAFAVAIFHNPQIVFLDEPTSGVDPLSRRLFWEMIYAAADKGITIFATTHYMDEAEYCNRVSIMVDGKLKVLDTPAALKHTYNTQSMNEVFQAIVR